jgi:hypothetical protein
LRDGDHRPSRARVLGARLRATGEDVYESQPVDNPVYVIAGTGAARTTYKTVEGPFIQAAALGVKGWRNVL